MAKAATKVTPDSANPDDAAATDTPAMDDSISGSIPTAQPEFALKSADLKEGDTLANAQVFSGMECTGQNVSPELEWSGAPAGTKSFAVTLYDPDAPTGSGWWHWVMYNIPPGVTRLPSGAGDPSKEWMPGVTMGTTDFGKRGYGGPCPPKGDPAHHYVFTVHALDVETLDVPDNATAAAVGFNLNRHRLGMATLTGVYAR
jgi:Raf kinase inhibitor-like YbhB/YbcL family protein